MRLWRALAVFSSRVRNGVVSVMGASPFCSASGRLRARRSGQSTRAWPVFRVDASWAPRPLREIALGEDGPGLGFAVAPERLPDVRILVGEDGGRDQRGVYCSRGAAG